MQNNRHFRCKQGETKLMTVTIKDNAGTAVDLSGQTVKVVVTNRNTDTVLFRSTMTNANQTTATGQASYRLLSGNTLSVAPGKYDIEFEVIDGSGNISLYPLVDGEPFGIFEVVKSKIADYA